MTPREPPKPFTCLSLDKESRALLLALVKPVHGRVFADHVTLMHNPASPVTSEFQARAVVSAVMADGQGQAVLVELDHNAGALMAPGRCPHITLSCAPGTLPEHSNKLTDPQRLPFCLVLTGIVKTVVPK
jgi:hypothetical protein